MSNLKVSHVRLANVLGIEELEFSPLGFTEVTGGNGAGKTSVIEAIKAAVQGGHDATLLRKGQAKGEIVLVLSDGTEIKKRITEKNSYVDVTKGGMKSTSPAAAIRGLADLLSVNPIEFLRAPDKERVNVLMESMPITVDREYLAKLANLDASALPANVDGLDLIEVARKAVYDDRTGVNRAATEKLSTINHLRAALPSDSDEEEDDEAALIAGRDAVDFAKDRKLERIQEKLDRCQTARNTKADVVRADIESRQALRDTNTQGHRDKIAQLQQQIADLQAQVSAESEACATDVEKLREGIAAADAELAENKVKAAAAKLAAITEHGTNREIYTTRLTALEQRKQSEVRAANTRQTIEKLEAERTALERDSEKATVALEQIDGYKGELLGKLPIPGLEVRDGKVYRDGVSFHRLNTAQQVSIAIEIAKLRASTLGLICVDGLELLDVDAYEAFREQASKSGLQLVVSRVGTGPLAVSTTKKAA